MAGCIAGCQYIPSVEFFAHWLHHGKMAIEAHEHFQKKSWRNSTAIVGREKPLILSVPLRKGKHYEKPIRDVEIAYDEAWYRIHFNSIRTAYGKTPFFEEIETELKDILYAEKEKLFDLNFALLSYMTSLLPGSWPVEFTTSYLLDCPEDTLDLRKGVPAGRSSLLPGEIPIYDQIQRLGKIHIPNLSILDALCHLGPGTKEYLFHYKAQLYK